MLKKEALVAAIRLLSEPHPEEQRDRVERDLDGLPICEFCGCFIEETDLRCTALHDEVCAPWAVPTSAMPVGSPCSGIAEQGENHELLRVWWRSE